MRGFAMLTELLTAPALRSSALQLHLCREAASCVPSMEVMNR